LDVPRIVAVKEPPVEVVTPAAGSGRANPPLAGVKPDSLEAAALYEAWAGEEGFEPSIS
jgi:hypothetical protein